MESIPLERVPTLFPTPRKVPRITTPPPAYKKNGPSSTPSSSDSTSSPNGLSPTAATSQTTNTNLNPPNYTLPAQSESSPSPLFPNRTTAAAADYDPDTKERHEAEIRTTAMYTELGWTPSQIASLLQEQDRERRFARAEDLHRREYDILPAWLKQRFPYVPGIERDEGFIAARYLALRRGEIPGGVQVPVPADRRPYTPPPPPQQPPRRRRLRLTRCGWCCLSVIVALVTIIVILGIGLTHLKKVQAAKDAETGLQAPGPTAVATSSNEGESEGEDERSAKPFNEDGGDMVDGGRESTDGNAVGKIIVRKTT
ncbi:hypothetical protein K402DRAFT_416960 [Aulographum hederae CBS 113979]|uniref:Uncharacterized protein n=1 Tax=Aulographum hederae CBS 113979 TaxID=1176131 RepID=A0A6G1HEU7_9PEZI|nr:hypothetical protein K402DRAFT_416960 [Aulographum hederae CBS 113979]